VIRKMLQAKLHRATVTQVDINYEGSCGIDTDLLKASGLVPNQHIDIYNVTNGARFSTYIIPEAAGSGAISLNGAAARLVALGDIVIICAYSTYDEAELTDYEPVVILCDERNRPTRKV
jgi:aspartate 1-decarboxylase